MGKEVAADLNVLKFYFVICRLNRFQYSHRAARILFSDSDAIVAALGSCEIGNNFELKANWNIFVKNDCGRRHGVDTVCECLWLWQFHEAISQMVPSWDFHEEEHPSCASHRFFFCFLRHFLLESVRKASHHHYHHNTPVVMGDGFLCRIIIFSLSLLVEEHRTVATVLREMGPSNFRWDLYFMGKRWRMLLPT